MMNPSHAKKNKCPVLATVLLTRVRQAADIPPIQSFTLGLLSDLGLFGHKSNYATHYQKWKPRQLCANSISTDRLTDQQVSHNFKSAKVATAQQSRHEINYMLFMTLYAAHVQLSKIFIQFFTFLYEYNYLNLSESNEMLGITLFAVNKCGKGILHGSVQTASW